MRAVLFLLLACRPAYPEPCQGWSSPRSLGAAREPALIEASGLVASRHRPGSFWSHNDRGDGPRLFALGPDGAASGQVHLVDAVGSPMILDDLEDIAIGPGPDGKPWLTVADSGNNKGERSSVRLVRLAEPEVVEGQTQAAATVHTLSWPDGPLDAEALLHDPLRNELFLLSKEKGSARIYRVEGLDGPAPRLVAAGVVRLPGEEKLTGGDISPSGDRIFLRTKASVLLALRSPGQSVDEALMGGLCPLPAPDEPQGEAIAATPTGYVTLSEGASAVLYEVRAP